MTEQEAPRMELEEMLEKGFAEPADEPGQYRLTDKGKLTEMTVVFTLFITELHTYIDEMVKTLHGLTENIPFDETGRRVRQPITPPARGPEGAGYL